MGEITSIRPTPRPWREVAREQAYSMHYLGRKLGRARKTMYAYAGGRRRVPRELLDIMSELFGEPVR